MGKFGWSYPPGCSGPPEYPDPSPESERVYGILAKAGVDESVIYKVVEIIDGLADKLAADCPACERRALQSAREAEEAAETLAQTLPESSLCPHGLEVTDCNPCMVAGDMAYDAARERRIFGR